MSDPDKKSFLTKLLDLNKYEKIEDLAKKTISGLEISVGNADSTYNVYKTALESAKEALGYAQYDGSLSEGLSQQKNNVEFEVKKAFIRKKEATKAIEEIRQTLQKELEIALQHFRVKIQDVNNRPIPAEIDAIKAELIKQQARLEKCRQYDNDQKLKVTQQRAAVEQESRDLINKYNTLIAAHTNNARVYVETQKSKLNQELAEATAKLKEQQNELQNLVRSIQEAQAKLPVLKLEEEKLRQGLCPTCKQLWKETSAKLEETLAAQQKLEEFISSNSNVPAKLIEVKEHISSLASEAESTLKSIGEKIKEILKTQVDQAETEKEAVNKKRIQDLSLLQDPVPHKAGADVKARILDLEGKLSEANKQFNADKAKDISLLFEEEKQIKAQFAASLDSKILEQQKVVDGLTIQIDKLNEQIRGIDGQLAEQLNKQIVLKERETAFNKAKSDLEQALVIKSQLSAKLALESDIVALVGYKGFLGSIFSDILAEISSQANDILGQVANVRHLTIDFETEKEAVTSGNVTSKITPVIYNRGRKVSFRAGISGGMQAAVELGVDLAVGNVVSSRRGVYPNFLILDESLHGLGGVAKESCIEMLQSVAGERLVLVVDHSTEFCNLFNQVIEVEQVDGQSRIV
jgi:DNA repair exonuclease SbcCD ATPase subunit